MKGKTARFQADPFASSAESRWKHRLECVLVLLSSRALIFLLCHTLAVAAYNSLRMGNLVNSDEIWVLLNGTHGLEEFEMNVVFALDATRKLLSCPEHNLMAGTVPAVENAIKAALRNLLTGTEKSSVPLLPGMLYQVEASAIGAQRQRTFPSRPGDLPTSIAKYAVRVVSAPKL